MSKKLTVKLPVNPKDTAGQKRYIANVRSKGTRYYSWCADRLGNDLEMYSQEPYELVCRVKYTLR